MADPDQVSLEYLRKQLERERDLKNGGGGGTFDGMNARVAALEADMKEVRSDLKAIRIDTAEIKGKLSNIPSTWQMIGVFGGLIGLLLAGSGILFGIIRYLAL